MADGHQLAAAPRGLHKGDTCPVSRFAGCSRHGTLCPPIPHAHLGQPPPSACARFGQHQRWEGKGQRRQVHEAVGRMIGGETVRKRDGQRFCGSGRLSRMVKVDGLSPRVQPSLRRVNPSDPGVRGLSRQVHRERRERKGEGLMGSDGSKRGFIHFQHAWYGSGVYGWGVRSS